MFIIEKFGLQNEAEWVSLLNKEKGTQDMARVMRYEVISNSNTRVLTRNDTRVIWRPWGQVYLGTVMALWLHMSMQSTTSSSIANWIHIHSSDVLQSLPLCGTQSLSIYSNYVPLYFQQGIHFNCSNRSLYSDWDSNFMFHCDSSSQFHWKDLWFLCRTFQIAQCQRRRSSIDKYKGAWDTSFNISCGTLFLDPLRWYSNWSRRKNNRRGN